MIARVLERAREQMTFKSIKVLGHALLRGGAQLSFGGIEDASPTKAIALSRAKSPEAD